MNQVPLTVRMAQFLVMVNALFWLVYAASAVLLDTQAAPMVQMVKTIFAALAAVCALLMLVALVLLRRGNRLAWYFLVVVLAVLAFLSITDQFGWIDLLSLLLSFIPLVLLVINHAWYLKKLDSTR